MIIPISFGQLNMNHFEKEESRTLVPVCKCKEEKVIDYKPTWMMTNEEQDEIWCPSDGVAE